MPEPFTQHALLRALHPGPLNPEQTLPEVGCTLGRDGRHAGLIVRRANVSRQHARLDRAGAGHWQISDLGSTNGTWVNGQRIEATTALEHGAVISLGRARVPDFEFLIREDLSTPRRVELDGSGPWTIGRALNHPLGLPADPVVSLDHARLRRRTDGLWVEDLHSRNGTWVDGRRIRRCRVDANSGITIGGNALRLQPGEHSLGVEIRNLQQALGVTINGLVTVAGDAAVNLSIRPGQLQLLCIADAQRRRRLIQSLVGLDPAPAGQLSFSEPAIDGQLERRRDRIGEVHPDCRPGPRQRLDQYLEDLACLALAKDLPSNHRRELIKTTLEALGISPAGARRWHDLSPLERQLGLIAGALLHRPGLLLVDLQARTLPGTEQLELLGRLRALASTSLSILIVSDQLLDAADDAEIIELQAASEAQVAEAAARPRPHRASLIRQRVLARRSLAGWVERPAALLEALALPVLLASGLWLALPARDSAKLGLIAVLISIALASAFQVSRWQAGLVYLTRRHLLLGDALVALTFSASLIGLGQAALAVMTLSALNADPGGSLLPAALAQVVPAAALGLACGLAAGTRPWLALGLVTLAVSVLILAAALIQANGGSGGLILTRLADLSPAHWAWELHQVHIHGGVALKAMAYLAGQALVFLGLGRLFLRRRLY